MEAAVSYSDRASFIFVGRSWSLTFDIDSADWDGNSLLLGFIRLFFFDGVKAVCPIHLDWTMLRFEIDGC